MLVGGSLLHGFPGSDWSCFGGYVTCAHLLGPARQRRQMCFASLLNLPWVPARNEDVQNRRCKPKSCLAAAMGVLLRCDEPF